MAPGPREPSCVGALVRDRRLRDVVGALDELLLVELPDVQARHRDLTGVPVQFRDGSQRLAEGEEVRVAEVASINVGAPQLVEWQGRQVRTAIWKHPVPGPRRVDGVNVSGDDQGDRSVHGGPHKAVYAYALEDLEWWAEQLGSTVQPGLVGENLTTRGLRVSEAVVGERWHVGGAVLQVSQPRIPCYKLGLRLGDDHFPRRFAAAGRPGAYLRILVPGEISPGDPISVSDRPAHGVTVAHVARAYHADHALVADLVGVPELAPQWQAWAAKQLEARTPGPSPA